MKNLVDLMPQNCLERGQWMTELARALRDTPTKSGLGNQRAKTIEDIFDRLETNRDGQ